MKLIFALGVMMSVLACSKDPGLDKDYTNLFLNKEVTTGFVHTDTEYINRFIDIRYKSDDLIIRGVVILPRGFDPKKKWPVIIYNRGGNRDFGEFPGPSSFYDKLTSDEYIIFASQYRGSMYSEGKDEFGGKDINDILNLVKIVKAYSFVDSKNIFNLGVSRGGMMAYLTMKHGLKFNATTVWAGSTDQFMGIKNRPDMEKYVYSELVPNYEKNKEEELKNRSVYFWPEKINAPLLLVHGDKDKRVSVESALKLETKLKELNKVYKLRIFKGGEHFLVPERNEVISEIHAWFEKYTN